MHLQVIIFVSLCICATHSNVVINAPQDNLNPDFSAFAVGNTQDEGLNQQMNIPADALLRTQRVRQRLSRVPRHFVKAVEGTNEEDDSKLFDADPNGDIGVPLYHLNRARQNPSAPGQIKKEEEKKKREQEKEQKKKDKQEKKEQKEKDKKDKSKEKDKKDKSKEKTKATSTSKTSTATTTTTATTTATATTPRTTTTTTATAT